MGPAGKAVAIRCGLIVCPLAPKGEEGGKGVNAVMRRSGGERACTNVTMRETGAATQVAGVEKR